MANAIVVYGSTTGNTETLSGFIADALQDQGVDVTVQNVADTDVDELLEYDIIALGCSTWGEGELQDDFIPFYDEMEGMSLAGKKGMAFGPGDSSYDSFCAAVDILENRLRECGANIVVAGLKIDGDINAQAEDSARKWAKKAAMAIA